VVTIVSIGCSIDNCRFFVKNCAGLKCSTLTHTHTDTHKRTLAHTTTTLIGIFACVAKLETGCQLLLLLLLSLPMKEKIGPKSSSLSLAVGVAALFVQTNILKLLIMMTFHFVRQDLDCASASALASAL